MAITSDHGEEFWDHVELGREFDLPALQRENGVGVGHGHTLFPELIEVPLILHGTGLPPTRVTEQLRLVDLAPTLLSLAGIPPGTRHFEGLDVIEPLRRERLANRVAVSETWGRSGVQHSLRTATHQLIRMGERTALFDSTTDPPLDVSGEFPGLRDRMSDRLERELARVSRAEDGDVDVDPELVRRLKALGYAQ